MKGIQWYIKNSLSYKYQEVLVTPAGLGQSTIGRNKCIRCEKTFTRGASHSLKQDKSLVRFVIETKGSVKEGQKKRWVSYVTSIEI